MAGDDQERTEDPTEKKLADSRKKGQIARSKDLGTAFVLIFSAVALLLKGEELGKGLATIMIRALSLNRDETYDTTMMFSIWVEVGKALSDSLPMIFFIILMAAFIGNSLLGGFNLSAEAMMPKASKMSPAKGIVRMFGPKAFVELAKSLLKFFAVAGVSYFILSAFFPDILHLGIETTPFNIISAVKLLAWAFLGISTSLLVIAAVDAPYQVYSHNKQLKMSKQEVKDEYKDSEGSPEIKARIRRTQREMSQRRMMAEVPTADVVVTNPTHYSVAIRYDTQKSGAPMLVAKGADEMAFHIRTIAKEHKVPIIESPMLARSLYYTTEIDAEVPEQLFVAVAQVLAYVFQLNQFKARKGRRPTALKKNLPIPPAFRR
ncbi:MAG: flagellar biosynthetic protein FlhB [Alteromonadaceae bacterium]|jgi:flagellar biosynthetic protein FlhB